MTCRSTHALRGRIIFFATESASSRNNEELSSKQVAKPHYHRLETVDRHLSSDKGVGGGMFGEGGGPGEAARSVEDARTFRAPKLCVTEQRLPEVPAGLAHQEFAALPQLPDRCCLTQYTLITAQPSPTSQAHPGCAALQN